MNTNFKTSLGTLFLMGLCSLLIVVINRYTEIDADITNLFFDAQRQIFPLKEVRWLNTVFHEGLKYVSATVWFALLVKLLLLLGSKKALATAQQKEKSRVIFNYSYVLIASLLAAVLTTFLKTKSIYACPWGLSMYGASGPHLRLFDSIPGELLVQGFEPGKCFPSGHASVGFMWLSLLMLDRPSGFPRKPVLVGFVVLMCLLSSGVQIIRGAHFLSHVLSTGVFCWFVVWLTHLCMYKFKPSFSQ